MTDSQDLKEAKKVCMLGLLGVADTKNLPAPLADGEPSRMDRHLHNPNWLVNDASYGVNKKYVDASFKMLQRYNETACRKVFLTMPALILI